MSRVKLTHLKNWNLLSCKLIVLTSMICALHTSFQGDPPFKGHF